MSLHAGWLRWRNARTLARRPIPQALWDGTLERFPFLEFRNASDLAQLRELSTLFLSDKEFTGAQGLVIDDHMAVAIAAQACLPILHLGLQCYGGFKGIVVHADAVLAQRTVTDDDGVVHQYEEELSGEAMAGGPVMLSWHDVTLTTSTDSAYNVVIHEFVHVLDLCDGVADGIPPLPDRAARANWCAVMESAYEDFCRQLDRGADTVIDPYGSDSLDEFFAVASEAFFVAPTDLRRSHAELYALLAGYFRQDPAAHRAAP